jgi:hypothetical protein
MQFRIPSLQAIKEAIVAMPTFFDPINAPQSYHGIFFII